MTMRMTITIDHDYYEHRSSMVEAAIDALEHYPTGYFNGRTFRIDYHDQGPKHAHGTLRQLTRQEK